MITENLDVSSLEKKEIITVMIPKFMGKKKKYLTDLIIIYTTVIFLLHLFYNQVFIQKILKVYACTLTSNGIKVQTLTASSLIK